MLVLVLVCFGVSVGGCASAIAGSSASDDGVFNVSVVLVLMLV